MFLTCDVVNAAVCLCGPSLTVCDAVVCVRLMTCVPYVGGVSGGSAELWRFKTSTRGWERVDNTTTNGAGPIGRRSHVMTSVGLDLWLHGGLTYLPYNYGECDTCSSPCRCCCCCVEGESVPLHGKYLQWLCGVCTVHDLCVYGS